MIASNVPAHVLKEAALAIGVTVELTPLSESGLRHRVKVNPGAFKDEDGDRKYQRESAMSGRRVFAVCWHGFRDFFREVYKHAPEARFYTAFDKWLGSEDFEERYRASGHRNIGSAFAPVCAAEACRCPESGMAL